MEEASKHGRTEYGYNAFNQQTFVLMKDGGAQENWYDAEFLRAEVAENGCRSRFLYYNGELLAESEINDTVRNRYILGYGVAASWQKEGYHSYHLDEQNSTAYITDSGRRIENSYQYDAFGVIREKKENVYNRILYTGQQYDQVTGQHYLRARYYNSVVGRFPQEDIYREDGLNLYTYCHNNPVVYYDPSGLMVYGNVPQKVQASSNYTGDNFSLLFAKQEKTKVYLGMVYDSQLGKYRADYVGITKQSLTERLNQHLKKGKNFESLVEIAEFDYKYQAKGYEQVIKEMKTDPLANPVYTYQNLDNSISPVTRPDLYDEATSWAIDDMKKKGYMAQDGDLPIIANAEEEYNKSKNDEDGMCGSKD